MTMRFTFDTHLANTLHAVRQKKGNEEELSSTACSVDGPESGRFNDANAPEIGNASLKLPPTTST